VEEITGLSLLSLHNVYYYNSLMKEIRTAITGGKIDEVLKTIVWSYKE